MPVVKATNHMLTCLLKHCHLEPGRWINEMKEIGNPTLKDLQGQYTGILRYCGVL